MSDLFREIEAIEYEHWMLLETANAMSVDWEDLDVVRRNALVESHAMHLRNLIEFLFHHTKTPQKVMRASDYLSDWRNEDQPKHLGKIYGRASEEIAHLSRGRCTEAKTKWEHGYSQEIDRHLRRWLARAPSEVRQHFANCKMKRAVAVGVIDVDPTGSPGATNATFGVNTLTIPPPWSDGR